jgi:hypothetical protein
MRVYPHGMTKEERNAGLTDVVSFGFFPEDLAMGIDALDKDLQFYFFSICLSPNCGTFRHRVPPVSVKVKKCCTYLPRDGEIGLTEAIWLQKLPTGKCTPHAK